MKKYLNIIIPSFIIIGLIIVSLIFSNYQLSQNQLDTLLILSIICLASVLYCFIVGQITNNTSQMDKLWSLLPIVYAWVIAARGGYSIRLLAFAIIVTLWGIRLTINFARKGAYSIRFWEGKEDYRWEIVRNSKAFQAHKSLWVLFNLLFISFYQNVLVLGITLPGVAFMESTVTFGYIDLLATFLSIAFLVLETVADEIQWVYHQTKAKLLKEYGSLDKLPYPYSLGFNTLSIWGYMRHPNYLGEQGIWIALYIFAIGAGVTNYYIFDWTLVPSLLLIFLFLGSAELGENISSSKYPLYKEYKKQVFKYLPIRKYKNQDDTK